MKLRDYILLPTVGAVMFGLGICYKNNLDKEDISMYEEVRESSTSFSFINPLLECSFGPDYLSKNHAKPSKAKIESLILDKVKNREITLASVYYRDLNNGPWMGINEKEKFFPASLMKVPLAMYFYKKSEEYPGLLNVTISPEKIPEEITFEQYFKPTRTIDTRKAHTIQDLIDASIIYSDNRAAETLIFSMEPNGLANLLKELHLELPNENEDFMNVKEYATFFRVLFNSSYLSQNNSEKLLELLSKTEFKDGITKYIPENIIVAHKFGEKESSFSNLKQFHDCGIVYIPSHPYLACIMVRGTDMKENVETTATISKIIYDEVVEQL